MVRMKRIATFAVAVVGIALFAAGSVMAHSVRHDTATVGSSFSTTSNPSTWSTRAESKLTSPAQKCVGDRHVRIVGAFGSEKQIVDSGRSSRNGHVLLAGGGPTPAPDSLTLKVLRKRFGSGDHNHVCRPYSQRYFGSG